MKTALKFTGIATEGDTIRGEDFPPRPDVGACYMQGVVVEADCMNPHGVRCFKVLITERAFDGEQLIEFIGAIGYIPHESVIDWDGRVQKVRRG